ncbi:ectoine synthase [Amycolatopsis sp. GM8]|uniref:ectoine synthase n=1 Tax=Amycolatopsis sp. GM8 TaxID=2896530 RepID=UPI001F004197|nr:ectoine synthase [Amycolatopsis sp. GM8]
MDTPQTNTDIAADAHYPHGIIQAVTAHDVPDVVIDPGQEHSRRLVTKRRQGSQSLSFHITTYTANYESSVSGDGLYEVVMYCISGSTRVVVHDGRVLDVLPGTALYLPTEFSYTHTVGPDGLVMAVACNPPKE